MCSDYCKTPKERQYKWHIFKVIKLVQPCSSCYCCYCCFLYDSRGVYTSPWCQSHQPITAWMWVSSVAMATASSGNRGAGGDDSRPLRLLRVVWMFAPEVQELQLCRLCLHSHVSPLWHRRKRLLGQLGKYETLASFRSSEHNLSPSRFIIPLYLFIYI